MNTIISGEQPDDELYKRILEWPELWDDKEIAAQYKEEVNDRQVHQVKKKEHDVMYNVRWAARNPRYTFEKMEALGEGEQQNTEEQDGNGEEVPEDMTEDPVTADAVLNGGMEDADDDEDDQGGEGSGYDDEEDMNIDADTYEADDYDDEDDGPIPSRAPSEGPAPFGGYYRV
jgi:general transcription factor 3C polypeptide 5 (transcription factor C subunit 1)